MVLLKDIVDRNGVTIGKTEKGGEVVLSVPYPCAIGGRDGGDNFDVAMEKLKEIAKNDSRTYFFINERPFRYDGTFAIGYITFVE